MSHIQRIGDKKYKIIIYLGRDKNGKQIRKTKTVSGITEPEAKRLMSRMEVKMMDNPVTEKDIALAEHIEEWLKVHKKNLKPLTLESYTQQIENHIIPSLGHIKLRELSPRVIDMFYQKKLENGKINGPGGLSNRSVRYLHSILHKILEQARKWQRISTNPADMANPPKKKKSRANHFTGEEIKNFFSIINDEFYRDFFELSVRAGMRRGQVLGLQDECIDWENGVIIVKQNLQRLDNEGFILQRETKNENVYTIPITKKIKAVLKRAIKRRDNNKNMMGDKYKDDGLIFCNDDGSPRDPDSITKAFERYAIKAGIKGTLHDLRHTFASLRLKNGTDIKIIQELLGHTLLQTTADIYTHVDLPTKRKAVEDLDDFF